MNPEMPQDLLDAASRMRDAVNLHVTMGILGVQTRTIGFLAILLEDGRAVENTLFDSRLDAVKHCRNMTRGIFYVKVGVETMGERESLIVLQMARQAYKRGVIFAEEEPIVPMLSELTKPFIPNTLQKLGIFRPGN